jgi:small conductance mechanosensitive channel
MVKMKLPFKIDYEHISLKLLGIILIIIGSMLAYYILVFIIKRLFSLSFKRLHFKNPYLIKRRQKSLEKITLSLLRYGFYFVAFLIILSSIGINIQTILTGAGILGVVFAVGSQNLIKDFVEGFFNVFEDNISIGDYVEIDGVEGRITDIGLRALKIKSFTGEIHIIPNSKIGHVINYSLEDGKALVDILVDYNVDLANALKVIEKSLKMIKDQNINIISTPTIMGVNKLQTIGYEIRIICLTVKETHWSVQRFMRGELMKAFKHEKIEIGVNQIKIRNNNISSIH